MPYILRKFSNSVIPVVLRSVVSCFYMSVFGRDIASPQTRRGLSFLQGRYGFGQWFFNLENRDLIAKTVQDQSMLVGVGGQLSSSSHDSGTLALSARYSLNGLSVNERACGIEVSRAQNILGSAM
jgi:hypothetical protein